VCGNRRRWHHHGCGCGCSCGCSCGCQCGCGCDCDCCQGGSWSCGSGGGKFHRRYQTRSEQVTELEAYLADLKAEVQAVEERLAELRK
jgi:FAD/FMN-containing dehydrogenase